MVVASSLPASAAKQQQEGCVVTSPAQPSPAQPSPAQWWHGCGGPGHQSRDTEPMRQTRIVHVRHPRDTLFIFGVVSFYFLCSVLRPRAALSMYLVALGVRLVAATTLSEIYPCCELQSAPAMFKYPETLLTTCEL